MRNWTYAASWIKKGKNPFEDLESKEPDPPIVGKQGPEVFESMILIHSRISLSQQEKLDAHVI